MRVELVRFFMRMNISTACILEIENIEEQIHVRLMDEYPRRYRFGIQSPTLIRRLF